MKPSSLSRKTLPWRPGAMRWIMQDLAGCARQPEQDHRTHLRASIEWLCRAQDAAAASGPGGVASGWSFESGWLPAETATTGRLVETFVPAAIYLAWPELKDRAWAMRDCLLAVSDNASSGRIQGLLAAHAQLGCAVSLACAREGGRELAGTHFETPAAHAEAGRVLAVLSRHAGDPALAKAARAHLQLALASQTPCGWFPDAVLPATGWSLAMTVHELVEAAAWLDDAALHRTARRAAQALAGQLTGEGWMAGAHDDGWTPAAGHACLAGLVRLVCVWLRLAGIDGDPFWRDAAWRALAWIKRSQRTVGDDLAQRDALPSSVPIWAGPRAFQLDALTLKYFADALMMDMVGITIPPTDRKTDTP